MKEKWLEMHEQLTSDYMDAHNCDWTTAYHATAGDVDGAVRDWYANQIDYWRMVAKEGLK